MLRRLAFVSCFAVLGAVALAPKAGAQQVVDFGGTVPSVCTFGTPVAGILAQNPAVNDSIEASGGITSGSVGTAATVSLDCTLGGKLSVGDPVQVSAPPGWVPTVQQAVVENFTTPDITSSPGAFGGGFWVGQPTADLTIPPVTSQSLKVGMVAGTNTNTGLVVKAGIYAYTVTLTVGPP
jgi:hypothetical protein